MVIVGALLPRLTPQLRSRMFFQLFNPMVTWINAGNRALRALSLVVVERLLSLADDAQRRKSIDAGNTGACDGWPDLQQNVYYCALYKYLHGSPEGRAFISKLGPNLEAFRPEELCSPPTLVNNNTDQGSTAVDDTAPHVVRQFPISVYELIKDSFKGMVMMVVEDETPPPAKAGEQSSSAMEQLVRGSGSQVPWAPGALDPPLPDYVVKYQERCKLVESTESAGAMPEPEGPASADVAHNAASDNDTVSFQRKILPNAAEIHPDGISTNEVAPSTRYQVSVRSTLYSVAWKHQLHCTGCFRCLKIDSV